MCAGTQFSRRRMHDLIFLLDADGEWLVVGHKLIVPFPTFQRHRQRDPITKARIRLPNVSRQSASDCTTCRERVGVEDLMFLSVSIVERTDYWSFPVTTKDDPERAISRSWVD